MIFYLKLHRNEKWMQFGRIVITLKMFMFYSMPANIISSDAMHTVIFYDYDYDILWLLY